VASVNKQKTGLSGAPGGITSLAQARKLFAARFLPVSFARPPSSSRQNVGNRSIAQTTQTVPPIQTTTIALVAGTLTWRFATPFNSSPIVIPSVQGSIASKATLYVASLAPDSVIITSYDAADTRSVYLTAIGNPN
jgi:hypothetical protein